MSETQDNALMRFLNEKLVPFSTKVAQNKYIQAIGQGAMGLMAIILVGSIFNLLNTLPFEPYQALLASSGLGDVFTAVYNAAMNFMGLFMVASVARSAAKSFGHDELTIENMFLALMGYLILVPLVVNDAGDSLANLNYLGSRGAFMAFIVALVTTKIHIAVVEAGITIKMPEGVPESVGKTFTAIIPAFFCALLFGAVRFAFSFTPYDNVIDAVYTLLQTPLAGLTGSLPGFIVIISYYNSNVVTTHEVTDTVGGNFQVGARNEYLTYSDWGWAMDPTGLQWQLEVLYDRYQVPLMVVENGLGAFDELVEEAGEKHVHDPYRIDYLRQHVHAMELAINNGVDLWGYTPWGCVDLVSMGTGEMRKRYGFVYVDMDDEGKGTLDRYRKDSFWWYQRCIASNGADLE